jgi:hypothetical protein
LDVVANLVGILIILVMVIGVRAKDAYVDAAADDDPASETPLVDGQHLASAARAVRDVESDIHRINDAAKTLQGQIDQRQAERDRAAALLLAAQQKIAEQRRQLDAARQEEFDLKGALAAARAEAEQLERRRRVVEGYEPQPGIIEHLPTPMAKTVFGLEEHFRLQAGRLSYVPLNQLVERLKEEARQKVWKLKDSDRVTEMLGPERGFRMRYTLRKVNQSVPVQGGTAIQQRIELDHFILVPVTDDLGEPLAQALADGSEFRRLIGGLDPQRTTITVWVYPDSYEEFRLLKQEMFRLGFVTAGRPLPDGAPIGGSPEGSRSASQ